MTSLPPNDLEPRITPLMSTRLATSERHAEALAQIRQMHDELTTVRDDNDQLRADLNRSRDQTTLVLEDRDRLRHELHIYRSCLLELATSMSNIHLLTARAADIMLKANELIARGGADDASDDPHTRVDAAVNALKEEISR